MPQHMKIRYVSLGIMTVVLALAVPTFAFAQQFRERIIQRLPTEKDEPIAITTVKVNDRSLVLGRKFTANDDWLSGLVISVKNISDKPILFASIRLVFPRPADSSDGPSIYDLSHGNNPLMTSRPTATEQLVGIMPGNTAELGLSNQEFLDLQRFLVSTGYPLGINRVDLRISHVIFDDDTMWYAGALLRRDPTNSSKWINSSLTKNR